MPSKAKALIRERLINTVDKNYSYLFVLVKVDILGECVSIRVLVGVLLYIVRETSVGEAAATGYNWASARRQWLCINLWNH